MARDAAVVLVAFAALVVLGLVVPWLIFQVVSSWA